MHLADAGHDLGGPPRHPRLQPVLHQGGHLQRQAQHDPAGRHRPRLFRRGKDRVQLGVGQARHHRRHHHPHRHARLGQPTDHLQTPHGQGRPRLHAARQGGVERGDGNPHPHQPVTRHWRQQVEIAFDQRALGGDRHRVLPAGQHLQHPAHQAILHLTRLVRVGIRPQRNRCHGIGFPRNFALQHRVDAGPRNQPGFEIQPR